MAIVNGLNLSDDEVWHVTRSHRIPAAYIGHYNIFGSEIDSDSPQNKMAQADEVIGNIIGREIMSDQYAGLRQSPAFHRLSLLNLAVRQHYTQWYLCYTDAEKGGHDTPPENDGGVERMLREALEQLTPFMEITFRLITQLKKEMRNFIDIFPGASMRDEMLWSAESRLTLSTGYLLLHFERRMSEMEFKSQSAGKETLEKRFLHHFAKNAALNYSVNQALLHIKKMEHYQHLTHSMRTAEISIWQLHITLYRALLAVEPAFFTIICHRLIRSLCQKNRLYRHVIAR